MSARRIFIVGLATQAILIALAASCARAFDVPPQWGTPLRDAGVGLVAALSLGLINHFLLTRAPANWLVSGVRSVYHGIIVPLFGRMSFIAAVVLGGAAGIGEEWFFRGIVQGVVGLIPASVLFGAAHVGSRRMLPFGVWATAMGAVMGWLALMTGGLIAPMVAHGVYDILALEYIRRDPRAGSRVGWERGAEIA
jgi:membrane protease YdiL (CAAX protease family)